MRRARPPLVSGVALGLAVALAAAACGGGSVDGPPPDLVPPTPTMTGVATGPDGAAADPSVSTTTARPPDTPSTTEGAPAVVVEIEREPIIGYAEAAGLAGGFFGERVVVTSANDRGTGTYRSALRGGDRYIVFDPALDGATIELESDVEAPGSNITVDASGIDITITGYATKFSGTQVVVAGLDFEHNDARGDEDALTFRDASETQVIGIYGNTFRTASDGLLDIIWNGGHDVHATVCGNAFLEHDKAMLVHSGENRREGGRYHITLCRNLWRDIEQRAPLSRDAFVHQVNDVFREYGAADGEGGGSKAGSGELGSQHLLEGNIAIPRAVGDTVWTGETVTVAREEFAGPSLSRVGRIRIDGSLLRRSATTTATQTERDRDLVDIPETGLEPLVATDALAAVVEEVAGSCPAGEPFATPNPCGWPELIQDGRPVRITTSIEVERVDLYLGEAWVGRAESDDRRTWSVSVDLSRVEEPEAALQAVATVAEDQVVWSDAVASIAV